MPNCLQYWGVSQRSTLLQSPAGLTTHLDVHLALLGDVKCDLGKGLDRVKVGRLEGSQAVHTRIVPQVVPVLDDVVLERVERQRALPQLHDEGMLDVLVPERAAGADQVVGERGRVG